MSTLAVNRGKLNWIAADSIWTVVALLFYSLLVQIPVYYYLVEIAEFTSETYKYIVYIVPLIAGIFLFFMMILAIEYYWTNEKLYSKRNIVTVGSKSALLITIIYYTVYIGIFGGFLNNIVDGYANNGPQEPIQKLGLELGSSLFTVILIVFAMHSVQKYRGK